MNKNRKRYDKGYQKKSRYLTLLLRHSPEKENLYMDENSYVSVEQILNVLDISYEELEWIVNNDNKSRFKFNYNNTKIRACQGHSIPWLKIQYQNVIPPDFLYHGTCEKFFLKIKNNGIYKMNRQYVHLSEDLLTAKSVGKRHGNPIIIKIDTKNMLKDGIKFYISENGVWLTDFVDRKYFKEFIK